MPVDAIDQLGGGVAHQPPDFCRIDAAPEQLADVGVAEDVRVYTLCQPSIPGQAANELFEPGDAVRDPL
jgi:hypothetical protein